MRKWLLLGLGAIVAVMVVAAVAVRVLLSPAMLRSTIEQQGSAWLGQQVTIGSARARVFPTAGVELTDVTVAGPVALTADEIVVRADFSGLLRRQVEEAVLQVRRGRLTIAGDAGGEPRATEPAPPANETGAGDSGGFRIVSVKEIVLEDVTVAGGGRELTVSLNGALDGDRFEIERLAASSGETSLEAAGVITSLARLDGELKVTSPLVDVDEVLAVMGAFLPAGDASAGGPAAGVAEPPGVGHITADVEVAKARALGYEIEDLRSTVLVQGTTLTADPLTFALYGGKYESGLTLDFGDPTALAHRASLAGASVAQLASLLGQSGAATGSLALKMAVEGRGRDFTSAAEQARGTAAVRLSNGTIAGLDVVRSTFALLGASAPAQGQGERYEYVTADLAVAGGALRADDFVLHSPDFDLKGRVAMTPAGALDGEADLILSEALSKEAQQKNKDLKLMFEGGRITLPASIGGTLAKPRVLPDLGDAMARAARNKLDSEIDKAKDRATDEIRKGLDRLFQKPPR